MADTPQLRGADPVNDELEVGFNQGFETGWHRAELIGRAVIVLVVAAGLAGLLGRGPFSHQSARTPDGLLSVDFEPVARFNTPTQVTLHVRPITGQDSVRLELSSTLVEPLGLQSIQPRPLWESARGGDVIARLAVPPDVPELFVRLHLLPAVAGIEAITARLDAGPRLRWSQFIVP
jgi:hypothetical protein